jgi:uncharacterized protein
MDPLLEYPVDYPLKVIGVASEGLAAHLRGLVLAAAPGIALGEATVRPSSGGRYLSVTMTVRLSSEEERVAIHAALASDPGVVFQL